MPKKSNETNNDDDDDIPLKLNIGKKTHQTQKQKPITISTPTKTPLKFSSIPLPLAPAIQPLTQWNIPPTVASSVQTSGLTTPTSSSSKKKFRPKGFSSSTPEASTSNSQQQQPPPITTTNTSSSSTTKTPSLPISKFTTKAQNTERTFKPKPRTKLVSGNVTLSSGGSNNNRVSSILTGLSDEHNIDETPMPENTSIEESKTAPITLPYVKNPPENKFLTLESVGTMFDTTNSNEFFLMSFPSYLPVYPPENDENDNSNKLRRIPEGLIGKLRIHKSGKVTMKIGDMILNVNPSQPSPFIQQLVTLNADTQQMCMMDDIKQHIILTPNISNILNADSNSRNTNYRIS